MLLFINSVERSSWHGWEAAKPKVLSSYRHLNSGKSHFCLGFGEAVWWTREKNMETLAYNEYRKPNFHGVSLPLSKQVLKLGCKAVKELWSSNVLWSSSSGSWALSVVIALMGRLLQDLSSLVALKPLVVPSLNLHPFVLTPPLSFHSNSSSSSPTHVFIVRSSILLYLCFQSD